MARFPAFLRACVLALLISLTISLATSLPLTAQSPNEALFNAVEVNDIDAVEAAISAGADLSAKNADGMTPADVAVDLGHFRIAHILLSKRTQPPSVATQPRVTDKVKEALTQPKRRVAAPRPAMPDPRLSDLVPPKKPQPVKAPDSMPEATAETDMPPTGTPAQAPMPSASPGKAPPPEMRPDDEIANTNAMPPKETAEAPDMAANEPSGEAAGEDGGFLTSLWGEIRRSFTTDNIFGRNEDVPAGPPKDVFGSGGQRLTNPADRFGDSTPPESTSSAGRMVDRMTGMVGSNQPAENEFGLPQSPVVPPLPESTMQPPGTVTIERTTPPPGNPPGLAAPSLETETAEVPGLAVPVLPPSGSEPMPEIPGLAAPTLPPAGEGMDVPGLEMPGLAAPELPDGPAPPDPESPGLEIPGLAAPAGEVPGIIPPPSESAGAIPALPPGLEPLPGSDTGQLRRPGGLIEPSDPNVLPPPGGGDLQARLKRIDEILNRNPTQNTERYLTPRGTDAETGTPNTGAPRTAPAKAPVTKSDPFLEIPKGLETPRTAPRQREPERSSPAEILRRARESEAVMREREIHANKPGRNVQNIPRPMLPSGHQLPQPDKPITAREEPSSRMMARFRNLTGDQYENEDVHGLPIVRQPIAGGKEHKTIPPRKDIQIAGLPADEVKDADAKIQKLARFFRGDQEEEAGMKPPQFKNENRVEKEPLPRVIDNLMPENDPARGQVVDDKLLDLRGVELRPETPGTQAGATATRNGDLDQNFLERLTSVLGPTRAQPGLPGDAPPPPEPGTIGLGELDVPKDQMIQPAKPAIPDPWTMTVERKDAEGQKQTLGVTAISPEDGSEIRSEQGVVSEMVGRIRQLFKGPKDLDKGPQVEKLDDQDRQAAAERLLSDALRDGAPTALPDQGQWPVTEVDTINATPGVPPAPRPGVLTRTSLEDVVLSLGESVTLENTLPPQQDGIDPLNACVKKNRGTTLFCIEPVDWPQDLRPTFVVPTILYTGPSAITRYDQGSPSRFHALFESDKFEQVVAYYQVRYGEPTEIWKRSIAPLAKPRMDNPTVTWRSRDSRTNVISVLEIRKFDDSRGGFPDTNRGAVMLYHFNAPSIFPQVSSHELMRLRRANK
ncbi:hypothetical protein L2D14_10340 [Thalassospiraceae bacterium LMO-JJ14]|nr:hypothetical protein L2D14_10340 [Thalassospiraceae bacterium LMO-JJ14]